MPVTVVPTSSATVAIDTFMTELSSVIRNWPVASVTRTSVAPSAAVDRPAPGDETAASTSPRAGVRLRHSSPCDRLRRHGRLRAEQAGLLCGEFVVRELPAVVQVGEGAELRDTVGGAVARDEVAIRLVDHLTLLARHPGGPGDQ